MSTYNVREIKSIINQAIEWKMFETRDKQEIWDELLDLKTRLFDMFGIEEL